MANVTRYDAKDTSVVIGGVYITGLGEDMVSIEKEEALAEPSVGAQGDVVHNVINNPIWNIRITIQATSPQRKYLLDLKNRNEPVDIWVINKALGMRAGGTQGFITEMPEISLGAEAEDIEVGLAVYDGNLIME